MQDVFRVFLQALYIVQLISGSNNLLFKSENEDKKLVGKSSLSTAVGSYILSADFMCIVKISVTFLTYIICF